MKRVVVTGMAGITSLGSDWASIEANFVAGRSGIRRMDEWDRFTELNTRLAGPIDDFVVPTHWTRKQLRSMGRVSRLAVGAAEQALQDAGLLGNPIIRVLQKLKLPRPLAAVLVVAGGLALTVALGQQLAQPAAEWFREMPQQMRKLAPKLQTIAKPVPLSGSPNGCASSGTSKSKIGERTDCPNTA